MQPADPGAAPSPVELLVVIGHHRAPDQHSSAFLSMSKRSSAYKTTVQCKSGMRQMGTPSQCDVNGITNV